MSWPSDDQLFKASNIVFIEAEQLLAANGINTRDMLASYKAPAPQKTCGLPITQPLHPQTLHDLLKLYAATPTTSPTVEDQIELCEMVLVSNNMDKMLSIMPLPDLTVHDEQAIHTKLSCYQNKIEKTFICSPHCSP
ncbi:hypothetical protein PAXINDRAFT_12855 [Paxillus involutus ATCC 200175]|uniref:Uncharacterized protein n=1 Tax=Paxillus involutus ATCC 200175 TaxID=664439 RepID=A0A0C9U4U7_PAXIN|nr:hypothetical protein PAXINDRAFT_12855 [Paxillus involutus ATCC 200175]